MNLHGSNIDSSVRISGSRNKRNKILSASSERRTPLRYERQKSSSSMRTQSRQLQGTGKENNNKGKRSWKALVMYLSGTCRDPRRRGPHYQRKVQEDFDRHTKELSEICSVETWPPSAEELRKLAEHTQEYDNKNSSTELTPVDNALWLSFGETFRRSDAPILILVNDGRLDKDQRYNFPNNAPYALRASELAQEILSEFKRKKNKFEIVLLAGLGTMEMGERMADQFDSLPLMVPPSILCWDAERDCSLRDILKFNISFLSGSLEGRSPTNQNRLDLRGTIHTFVSMCRGETNPIYSSVHFFPRNQIDEIQHIYYRLGLSAFELSRRICQIADHGMIYRFQDDNAKEKYMMQSTLFLFAELFGWLHVLRQQPAQLYFQEEIRSLEWAFSGEKLHPPGIKNAGFLNPGLLQLYKFDQRGMGEAMVEQTGLERNVSRYIDFLEAWADETKKEKFVFFSKLENSLRELHKPEHYMQDKDGKRMRLIGQPRIRLLWIQTTLLNVVKSYTKELAEQAEQSRIAPIVADEPVVTTKLASWSDSISAMHIASLIMLPVTFYLLTKRM